jgi:hypothetical protein
MLLCLFQRSMPAPSRPSLPWRDACSKPARLSLAYQPMPSYLQPGHAFASDGAVFCGEVEVAV